MNFKHPHIKTTSFLNEKSQRKHCCTLRLVNNPIVNDGLLSWSPYSLIPHTAECILKCVQRAESSVHIIVIRAVRREFS